jgi:NAD(P)H-nitrite reductase large subunit
MPGIPGIDLKGVFCLRTFDDAQGILRWAKGARRAVVLGGGPVGLHSTEALLEHGLEVTVIITSDHVLSTLATKEATALIEEAMVARGVNLLFGQSVVEIQGKSAVQGVTLSSGQSLACDLVVVGKGVKPNTGLTRNTRIDVGVGVRVDSHQETREANVYAAGDVTESYDAVRKGPRLNAMWPNAVFQGRIAGLNMAGRSAANNGYVNINTGAFFDIPIAVVGLSGQEEIPCQEIDLILPKGFGQVVTSEEVDGVRKLLGAVLIGDTRGAGVLHTLTKSGVNVAPHFEELVNSRFSYAALVGRVSRLL